MPKQKSHKRRYDSSRRQAQARETKMKIAQASRRLFIEYGYAGATIEAIAGDAGVAKETVYSIFKNKRNILAFLLDISVGGDDQPVRIMNRPGPQAVMRETNQVRQVTEFSRGISEIMERAAPVFEVMQIAAKTEPEIARRVDRLYQERLENLTAFIRYVAANGPLRGELSEKRAGETVWALTSPDLFRLLTNRLGWSTDHYTEWLTNSLIRLLLP